MHVPVGITCQTAASKGATTHGESGPRRIGSFRWPYTMQERYSPIKLGVTLLAVIFCIEGAMMFLLVPFAPKDTPTWALAIIDAGTLTALVSLFVWLLFVKPLKKTMLSATSQAKTILDTALDAIITIAEDGTILSCNPAAERMFGYSSGALAQQNVKILMPQTVAREHDGYLSRYLRRGSTRAITGAREYEALRKDGTKFPIELNLSEGDLGGRRCFTGIIRDIAERKAAQQSLLRENERYRALMETAIDGIHIVRDGYLVDANPAFLRMLGYTREEALGLHVRDWEAGLSDPEIRSRIEKAQTAGLYEVLQTKHRRKDGTTFDAEVSLSSFVVDGQFCVCAAGRDISERKAALRKIERLTQMYALLSSTNQAVVRAHGDQELYDHLVRIPIGCSHFYGAVVRIADQNNALRAVAISENLSSVATLIPKPLNHNAPGSQGPISTAYREDRIVIENDFLSRDFGEQWQKPFRPLEIRAVAALPIRRGNKPIGAFVLNAREPDFFDADMKALLEEMTLDIAFAMDSIEAEQHRRHIEQKLAESEVKFRCLVEQSFTGISIVDGDRFSYVNPRFAEIHGYAPEEMIGRQVLDVIAEEDRPVVQEGIRRRLSGDTTRFVHTINAKRKDGSTIIVGVNVAPATVEGKPITITVVQDITEREQARRQIEAYIRQLEDAMLGTLGAVATMGELRDPYTAGHQRKVGLFAKAIGAEMGLAEEVCRGLEHIGRVHDLGKNSVPAEILSKPGPLSDVEFSMIKIHPQAGYEILKDITFPWPLATAILQHHERLDGSGYPSGIKGDELILEARILAVADTVEAIASHRPYRPTLGMDAAIDEITKYRGLRYDAKVVDACVRLFREKGFRLPE